MSTLAPTLKVAFEKLFWVETILKYAVDPLGDLSAGGEMVQVTPVGQLALDRLTSGTPVARPGDPTGTAVTKTR